MPRLFSMSPGFSKAGESAARLIEHRADPRANYWIFHSNKIDHLMVAETDVVFACSIFFEMDPQVVWYGAAPPQTPDADQEADGFKPDLIARYADGRQELVCCRREPGTSKKSMLKRIPLGVRLVTGRDVVERQIEFDNCLSLSTWLTATLDYTSPTARLAILDRIGPGTQGTIRQIFDIPGIDPGLLRGALASLVAEGTLVTDLTRLLSLETVMANITGSSASKFSALKRSKNSSGDGAIPGAHNPSADGHGLDETTLDTAKSFGTARSRRRLIPPEHRFAEWPTPEESNMSDDDRKKFRARKEGIVAYRRGAEFSEIKEKHLLSKNEVLRLVKRCITPAGPGSIHGYFALQEYYRIAQPGEGATTTRRKVKEQDGGEDEKSRNGPWAWTRLLQGVVGLEELITDLVLGHEPTENGKRIDLDDCWAKMKDFLRTKGLGDSDYPFTNTDLGRNALQNYIKTICDRHADRYIGIYHGETSSKRARQIGGTPVRIIRPIRPGSFLQLDYYRIDRPTGVMRRNPAGELFKQTLPRWYYALLVDAYHWSVLSRYPTLEINPSTASAIETLDRYVHPEAYRLENDPDGEDRLFYEQFEGMTGNGFNVLSADNAKCNLNDSFIRASIYTFGCAVNFGPTYNWVTRAVCERAIGDVSRRVNALHDGESAIDLDSFILDLARACNQHNTERTERLWQTSPLIAFRNALNNVSAGLIAAPLPRATIVDSKYLDHYFEAVVRGNLAKGVMPYCNSLGRRYTNDTLRSRPDLIQPHGSNETNLVGRVKRWDIRQASGAVNNIPIGKLKPDRQRDAKISVSDWKFFDKTGGNLKTRERLEQAASSVKEEALDQGSRKAKSKKPGKASAPTLEEERQRRRGTYHGQQADAENATANVDAESIETVQPVESRGQPDKTIWEGGVDRFRLRVIRGGRRFG
jgi:hypothetical protein